MDSWNTFLSKISKRYKYYHYHFNIRRLRFHRYHFHDPSKIHITCSGAADGGCAQLLRQLSTITFTRVFGFSYIHTPLSHVAHNVNNDPAWSEKWENFLQLSVFSKNSSEEMTDFKVVRNINELLPEIIRNRKEAKNQYYQIRQCHPFTNRVPEAHLIISDELRKSYRKNGRSLQLLYKKKLFNVAIHVRRGDVTNEYPERFTSSKKLHNVIKKIQKKLKGIKHTIYLFCVDLYDDLKELENENVRLVHELDIFDVMDHLIHADMLVTSKSSVSYVSAFLNEGIIIYEPFLHPPLPGWLNMDDGFENELQKRIEELQLR